MAHDISKTKYVNVNNNLKLPFNCVVYVTLILFINLKGIIIWFLFSEAKSVLAILIWSRPLLPLVNDVILKLRDLLFCQNML